MPKIWDLSLDVIINSKKFQASLSKLSKNAKLAWNNISKSISAWMQEATQVSKKLAMWIWLAITAIWAWAVTVGKEFESSMSNVATLIDSTTESMKDMKKEVLLVAKNSAKPLSELTSSLYDIRSAWVSASDAMTVLKSAEMLAVAGLSDTKQATDLLTSSFNSFSKQWYNANQISEILFKTVKNWKTTVSELAQWFWWIAGLASTVWVDFKELMSATWALTTTWLKASEVYSWIKWLLSNLLKPTSEAIKKSKELWIEFSVTALKTKWLKWFIHELKEKSWWSSDALSALFWSVEWLNAVMWLAWANADAFNSTLDDMNWKSWALQEAYEKQKQTFESSYQILKNQLSTVLIEIWSVILPSLANWAKVLANKIWALINFFKNWDEQSVLLRAWIIWIWTAITLALVPAFISATLAVKAFTVALLANPVTWIIAWIAIAVWLLYVAWNKNFLWIKDITEKIFLSVSDWFIKIKEVISLFTTDTQNTMSIFYNFLSEQTWISFESIKLTIEIALSAITKIFKWFKLLFTGQWRELWSWIKLTLNDVMNSMKILVSHWLDFIWSYLKSKKIEFINTVSNTWNWISDVIIWAMSKAWNYVRNIINKIKSSFSSIWSSIKSMVWFKLWWFTWFAEWWPTWNWSKNVVAWIVHRWEYVIPKNMVNAFPNLISKLETLRIWNNWVSNSDHSRHVTVENVNVNNWLDFEDYLQRVAWQMW